VKTLTERCAVDSYLAISFHSIPFAGPPRNGADRNNPVAKDVPLELEGAHDGFARVRNAIALSMPLFFDRFVDDFCWENRTEGVRRRGRRFDEVEPSLRSMTIAGCRPDLTPRGRIASNYEHDLHINKTRRSGMGTSVRIQKRYRKVQLKALNDIQERNSPGRRSSLSLNSKGWGPCSPLVSVISLQLSGGRR
jgi:hypothetical protein